MTVPGGDSGENAQGDTDRPPPEAAAAQPEQGTSPSSPGFEARPGPPPGYPPSGYPPAPGFDVPPGPPTGPPPGYPPPGPPTGYPPSGYGTPYPGGGYDQPYDQPRPGKNSLAITSLVVSIIGILPYCGGVLSIVGIVLGAIALNQIKKTGEAGYGLAVAGIAVGVVTLVIGLIITISLMPYRL